MAADPPKERTQAEAKFKKAQRATEGAQAMSEYNAERQAERAKTARLRELRLAKEAADKASRDESVTKTKKPAADEVAAGKSRGEGERVVRNGKTPRPKSRTPIDEPRREPAAHAAPDARNEPGAAGGRPRSDLSAGAEIREGARNRIRRPRARLQHAAEILGVSVPFFRGGAGWTRKGLSKPLRRRAYVDELCLQRRWA